MPIMQKLVVSATFLLLALFVYFVLTQRFPTSGDDYSYLYQAKLFASGKLYAEDPISAPCIGNGAQFKPDLVLVDLIMAQEDGIEVAAQLEADWALHGVPIVFLTSLITAAEAKDGRRVYGHRILPKPTSSSDLFQLVEQNLPCCAEG